MGKRKIFYTLSSTLILIGLINIFVRGFAFGIDFKGGVEVTLEFAKPINITEVREEASKLGLGEVEVKTFGGDKSILIRAESQEVPKELFTQIETNIEKSLNTAYPGIQKKLIEKTSTTIVYGFDSTKVLDDVAKSLNHSRISGN